MSVQYATSNGTAMAGGDYTTVNGTLNWGAGELDEKTISVPLVNDTVSENDETFRITLSNLTGGAVIDGATSLDVSVTNDDVGAPPVNGGGGGGGGAIGIELLGLLGLLLLAVGREPEARGRAEERADQVRLWYHGRP